MKLKTVEVEGKTYGVVSESGNPIYVHDDGKEQEFDAPGTVKTISRLNGEAKGHREAKEAAENALKKFEGIEDPQAAIDALTKLKSLDDKKLIDAGEVEKVKAEAIKAVEEKYKPVVEERDKWKGQYYKEMIGGSFARSKFISEKSAVPADIMQARFGSHFDIKDGKIVATDASGNQIYSRKNAGDLADFDEALETLVDQYPYKEHILKGTGNSGSGARQTNGSSNGANKIARSEFDKLPPEARMKRVQEGIEITDN